MRKAVIITSMLLLISVLPYLAASEDPVPPARVDKRYIDIPYTFKAPELDGHIDPLEWNSELAMHYYDAFDGESFREYHPDPTDEEFTNQSELAVTFYLLYDDTYLYFAANITDDEIVVDSGSTYWRDDGVELLIDGAHDEDEDQRADDPWPGFQDGTTFLATADGSTLHDYSAGTPYERVLGADWSCTTSVNTERDYYIVEMRVMLDAISSPLPNSTIGLNIGVNDDDLGGDTKTALKWEGADVPEGANETFRNETLWGIGRLLPYVNASLPDRMDVDEDIPALISSNESRGNNPDFNSSAVFDWSIPLRIGGQWQNHSYIGPVLTYNFTEPSLLYTVRLTVTDPSGVSDEAVTYVHVRDNTPPEISPVEGLALEEELFSYVLNASDNVEISNVTWSLFDGTWRNSTTFTPSFQYTFAHPGIYELFFIVRDTSGNEVSGSTYVEVLDNRPPIVPDIPDVDMNTSYPRSISAEGSYDDALGDPRSADLYFNWTVWSEAETYRFQGQQIDMIIDVPGSYNATVEVRDLNNLTTTRQFKVTVVDTTDPVVDLVVPNIIDEGQVLTLDPWASEDNDPDMWMKGSVGWTAEQLSSSFRFTSDEERVNISFPGPGMANITLTLTDPTGNTASRTYNIEVRDAFPPILVVQIPDAVPQSTRFFLDLSGSSDNSGLLSLHYSIYRNDTGNLTLLRETPPFGIRVRSIPVDEFMDLEELWLNLSETGDYLIEIWILDIHDLRSDAHVDLFVYDSIPPTVVLNRTYAPLVTGELLLLSAGESSDASGTLTFRWMLDGEIFDEEGPEFGYVFTSEGKHNITVTVTDALGNSASRTCYVEVVKAPETGEVSGDNTLVLIWAFTISIILLGSLFLFLWARSKKRAHEGPSYEE